MKNILLILLVCSSLSFASDNLSKDEYIKSLETELKMYKHKYGEIKPNENETKKDKQFYVKDGEQTVEKVKENSLWLLGKTKELLGKVVETGKEKIQEFKEKNQE